MRQSFALKFGHVAQSEQFNRNFINSNLQILRTLLWCPRNLLFIKEVVLSIILWRETFRATHMKNLILIRTRKKFHISTKVNSVFGSNKESFYEFLIRKCRLKAWETEAMRTCAVSISKPSSQRLTRKVTAWWVWVDLTMH